MPWSIFTDGGGKGAAYTWATDLLKKIGAPLTAGNEQMVYDWEVSEGGGGKYNPLNQGPVPGQPSLTTTGQQYGGGAADYASWEAGLTGAADYLAMPAYQGVMSALLAGNPAGARDALIASPWAASHYGGGAAFSSAPLPGHASALPGPSGGGGFDWNPLSWPGQAAGAIGAAVSAPGGWVNAITRTGTELAILVPAVLIGGALIVAGLIHASGQGPKVREGLGNISQTAAMGAMAA